MGDGVNLLSIAIKSALGQRVIHLEGKKRKHSSISLVFPIVDLVFICNEMGSY